VAGDALKATDATWDEDVMKASELVMVDFWAVWCGPCQMVAPIVDELAKEYTGKIKVRKLNTDENPEIAGRYQVMSIPTILFFKNGQAVERLVGARPKRQFKEIIDSLARATFRRCLAPDPQRHADRAAHLEFRRDRAAGRSFRLRLHRVNR
jgi:thioredoxin 1